MAQGQEQDQDQEQEQDQLVKVRRIPDAVKKTWVSVGAYQLDLPSERDEFMVSAAAIADCSCLLAMANLEIVPDSDLEGEELKGLDGEGEGEGEEENGN